jgi:hypothetical protein
MLAPEVSARCTPSLPDAFVPSWRPPRQPVWACTTGQIQNYYDACQGRGATAPSCEGFESKIENTPCIQCLITTESRMTYGPYIRWPNGAVSANVAGCVAWAESDLGGGGCGARLMALDQCENVACGECTLTNAAEKDAFDRCKNAARETLCKPYVEAATCMSRAEFDRCFFGDDARFYFLGLSTFFCSTASDAGTQPEGGADDAAD